LKVIVSVFGVWGDGLPRFDGPVLARADEVIE
jgi:hypothetical protein